MFDTEIDMLLSEIDFSLTFIHNHIRSWFVNRTRERRGNNQRRQDDSVIPKGDLVRMWQERQKQAINIVQNDCYRDTNAGCHIDKTLVHAHFRKQCQRSLHDISPPPWNGELDIPPPEWTLPEIDFTVQETENTISLLPSHRAPGPDGVTYEHVKKNKHTLAPILNTIMNICIKNRRIPTEWKHAVITLVPKKNGNSLEIEDWRPISLLCTSYKLYMKMIQQRVVPWIVDTCRLSTRQKGSMPRNGLQEHVFTLKTHIADFLHQSSKMFIGFIDIKDAFGSLDHELMIREMREMGYPEQVVAITQDIYTNSSFQVKTASGLTASITRGKGIIQGCPWSVIVFEQGIDKWMRWVERDFTTPNSPTPIQGYVDDVVMTATTEDRMKEAVRKTELFMKYSGMKVKHRKCAMLHGQRCGNNWSKKDNTSSIEAMIQNDAIPRYEKTESYRYLGYDINLTATSEERQIEEIVREFDRTIEKIDTSPLPVAAKLQAINIMATSKLHFYYPNMIFSEKVLGTFENTIVSYVRHWLGLNNSSNRAFMFTPRSKGGLGMLSPRSTYHAKKMSFYLELLNSTDEQTRRTARKSLQLHLDKRKCKRASTQTDDCFAWYQTDNNYRLVKTGKVNWRRSQWVHVNELCGRLKIRLRGNEAEDFVMSADVDENIHVNITDGQSLYMFLKSQHLQSVHQEWREKESQGRLARADDINHSLSSSHLTNLHLSDKIVQFVTKARLQLLECNTLLHTYYPAVYTKTCLRCGHASEKVSHVLNGCASSKNSFQKRHDRIVEIVRRNVAFTNTTSTILDNKIIKPTHFGAESDAFTATTHTKPDLCLINNTKNTCTIIEVSVPFDAFASECYKHKFHKYQPLNQSIQELGFQCKTIVLVVGSLGSVHNRFVSGLKMTGIPNCRAKSIARFASVSAMIGSHIIWKQRCRHVLP